MHCVPTYCNLPTVLCCISLPTYLPKPHAGRSDCPPPAHAGQFPFSNRVPNNLPTDYPPPCIAGRGHRRSVGFAAHRQATHAAMPSTSAPFVSVRNTFLQVIQFQVRYLLHLSAQKRSLRVTLVALHTLVSRRTSIFPARRLAADAGCPPLGRHQAVSVSLPSFAQCHEHAACRIPFPSLVTRGISIGAGNLAAQRRQALPVAPWCHG
jgi:hypothetical protein